MEKKTGNIIGNRYRIGDFSRELGVTPDLLKYCEKMGIIQPEAGENHYRSYDFVQAGAVVEYLKRRNQGLSAREIGDALFRSSFADEVEDMTRQNAVISREITFLQARLEYNAFLQAHRQDFTAEGTWFVESVPDFLFLPHSENMAFLEDEAVRACVRSWNDYLPVVISAELHELEQEEPEHIVMGYRVDAETAVALGLPVESPVRRISGGRFLVVFMERDMEDGFDAERRTIRALAERLRLPLCGPLFTDVHVKKYGEDIRKKYIVYRIRIAE